MFKQLIKELRPIGRSLGVRRMIFFERKRVQGGLSYSNKGIIEIRYGNDMSKDLFLSIFFHEVTHRINNLTCKYIAYHNLPNYIHEMNTNHLKLVIKTGLKAEMYTDKIAKRLMKIYYPKNKYISGYKTKEAKKNYLTGFIRNVKMELESRKK